MKCQISHYRGLFSSILYYVSCGNQTCETEVDYEVSDFTLSRIPTNIELLSIKDAIYGSSYSPARWIMSAFEILDWHMLL